MILTDSQIIETYRAGDILIDPFEESQVQGATYDLRIGEQGATTTSKKVINIRENGYIIVQPGDFAVVTVFEVLKLGPQYVGRFGLRSKFARKGLIATTGPQIDPGYHGRLIIGLTNSPKPVTLSYGDHLISVEFHKLQEATTRPYCGPYQGRLTLGPEEIEAITQSDGMALSEVLTTLRSLSQNVGALTTEMKTFRWLIPAMITFGIAVVATIVAIK